MKPLIDIYHSSGKDCYIEVVNHGSFDAYFTVTYTHNNTDFSFKSKTLNTGLLDKVMLCSGGINIHVEVYILASNGELKIYDKTFPTTTMLKLLFTGTESNPTCTDVTKLPSPNDPTEFYNYYVSVTNTASYTAKLSVKYTIGTKKFAIEKDKIITNHTQTVNLPTTAQNIEVLINIKDKSTPWKSIFSNILTFPTIFKLSLSGTISDPVVTNISSNPSTGNLPTLSNNSISVINNGDFVSQFYVTYNLPDTTNSITTVKFSNGTTKSIVLPNEAINIDVGVNIEYTDNSWINIYEDFFSNSTNLKLELTGTLSAPVVNDLTNPPDLGDPPPLINPPIIKLTKVPDKPIVMPGDEVMFTLTISHKNGTMAESLKLEDTIPIEATFIPNSLTVNGNLMTKTTFPDYGVDLNDMNSGESHTITYKIKFSSIPNPNIVKNDPILTYNYTDTDNSLKEISLTGATMPLIVTQNSCCCCPCMCNCPSQDNPYIDYFNYI